MAKARARTLVMGAGLLLAACGGGGGGGGGGTVGTTTGFFLSIQGMAFSPLQLAVPPGGTVTVVNRDAMAHSVTSEASAGAFTPGEVGGVQFDTGPFTGQKTIAIPQNAADGTVVPFYCTVHAGAMATPNGSIRVDSSAQPGPAPGVSSPGTGY